MMNLILKYCSKVFRGGMVCAPTPEARVQCVVRYLPSRDFTNCRKYEVTLPSSTAVKELVVNVARMMKLEPFSIQLRLQTKTGLDKVFKETSDGILSDSGFCTDLGARNSLVLEGIDGLAPRTATMAPEAETNEDGGGTDAANEEAEMYASLYERRNKQGWKDDDNDECGASSSSSQGPVAVDRIHRSLVPSSDNDRSVYTFSMPAGRSSLHHGFVGLVNQAMTCYLNSLLQALYMTPEFRNAVYKWKFFGSEEVGPESSIPFQLQKLFVNLQTSSKPAVETTELTQSFGWKSSDVWQQQDIQELCRVMFDALETQFKDTDQADLINKLYEGKMMDYVKCLECGTEKSREDTFLDIPLSIKPFGSNVAYKSVEEALDGFVQPEILEGNNQYSCESCNKKCNAHKGLKFTVFPYILTLHLKRFDFDYSTTNRIKLNDKVEFPMTLNLNSFVDGPEFQHYLDLELHGDETGAAALSPSSKCDDSSKADSVLDEDTNNSVEPPSNDFDLDVDEGIDVSANVENDTKNNSPMNNRREAKGPYMYELYSIMIHSGSASGGHYYAYIKDLSKNEWYCFNDQSVSKITQAEIKKTFGGGPARSFYSGAYSSSTNAYMLMYRLIDSDKNCLPMSVEEFPQHIKDIWKDIREKEEEERAFRARQESMMKLHVRVVDPVLGTSKEQKVSVDQDCTFSTFFEIAYSQLNVSNIAPIENCRLVAYNSLTETIKYSLEGFHDKTIGSILSLPVTDFLIEIKEKDQIFLPCKEGDLTLPVYHIDPTTTDLVVVRHVHLSRTTSLPKIKLTLGLAFRVVCSDFFIAIFDYHKVVPRDLSEDGPILLDELCRIFFTPTEDLSDKHAEEKFLSSVNIFKNVVVLNVVIPDVSEEKLDKLLIPSLHQSKEDASDVTPTEDRRRAPPHLSPSHINEMVEEDPVAQEIGCTSDQSASEDSSLADSERTMIGDPQNESHLSSASDSEMRENGSDDSRDAVPDSDLFFKASPFKYKHHQMLKVVADRDMSVDSFKKRLEEFVGVCAKYMEIQVPTYNENPSILADKNLNSCCGKKVLHVKLHRVPENDEQTVKIYRFEPNSRTPCSYLFEWIITKKSTVGAIKKALYKYMKHTREMFIPCENLRLRKKLYKNPGRVLLDDEYILKDDSQCRELCVEELASREIVDKNTKALILTRHWQPAALTCGPFMEVALGVADADTLKNKIAEISSIPVEYLELSGPFQFNKQPSVNSLCSGLVTWEKERHESIDEFFRDGEREFFVLYKDSRDVQDTSSLSSTGTEPSTLVNPNLINENGRTGSESSSSSSSCRIYASEMSIYNNSYKKERELKIRVKVPKPE